MNDLVKKERILVIDLFLGISILTMLFVNDLASVKAMSAWMKHDLKITRPLTRQNA